jgi:hypothetical protein
VAGHLQRGLGVAALAEVAHRSEDVVALGVEPRHPLDLLSPAQVRLGLTHQVGEVAGVHVPDGPQLTPLGQPLLAVFADRLEHAVSVIGGLEQRLVDQGGQQVQDVGVGAHRLGAVRCGARREDREPLDEGALGVAEQIPAPRDDRA